MAVNTVKSLGNPSESILARAKNDLEIAKQKFDNEKKVKISIPESLKSRIGPTWFAAINGVRINIPVNGEKYEVPKSFADMWFDYQSNLTL